MLRFLFVFFLVLAILAGLFLLFLVSPLPNVILQKSFLTFYPETEFLTVKNVKLIPWQPLEIQDVEYQLESDPNEGILKIGNARFHTEVWRLHEGRPLYFEVEDIFFDSRDLLVKDIDARIPAHLKHSPAPEPNSGFLRVDEIQAGGLWFKDVRLDFTEENNLYKGDLSALWPAGKIQGKFEYRLFEDNSFKALVKFLDIDLKELSIEVGGVLKRAEGRCRGELHITGADGKLLKAEGRLNCPRPGGKFRSKFLGGLLEWLPDGTARDVFQQEVEGSDDYYYDEASLEVHNRKAGYWTVDIRIRNPKIQLEIPIEITEESFETVFSNKGLKRLVERWSEAV